MPAGQIADARLLLDSSRERNVQVELRYDPNPMKLTNAGQHEAGDGGQITLERSRDFGEVLDNLDPVTLFDRYNRKR